jgi:hypothetical protein
MSFLYIEEGIVKTTDEGMALPSVNALYRSDKTEKKKYFNDCLKYIFFVYKKDGVYKDMMHQHRKRIVINRHFEKRKEHEFEGNLRVVAVIEEYLDRQHTKMERFYYQLEQDIEKLLERIHNIPYVKKVKAKVPYEKDGEEIFVMAEVEIENYDEKSKAMMLADKLVDYEEKLRSKILKEKMENKKKDHTRLFDKKEM